LGDVSERGMRQSTGMMVNYIYELNTIEKNHEEYAKNNKIIASSNIRKLLKT
jgi:malonyl-CoA decarboxylase